MITCPMRRTSGMIVPEPGAALAALALEPLLALAVQPQGRALDRDLPVRHDLQQLPQPVGDDADQEHLHQGAGELRAEPLGGQVVQIQPPEPDDHEDQHHDGQGPPAAHEPELGLLVGGPQRPVLLRVAGPDCLDQRGDRQLHQRQRQDQRERDVQRRVREALEVAGGGGQLQDQPLEHDEHDRDHRPQRREAAPGRTVPAAAQHHAGDAGPRLPEGQRHEAVEDHREPEAQAPPSSEGQPNSQVHACRLLAKADQPKISPMRQVRNQAVRSSTAQSRRCGRVGASTKRATITANQVQPSDRTTCRTTVPSAGMARLTTASTAYAAVTKAINWTPWTRKRPVTMPTRDPRPAGRQAVQPRFGVPSQPAGAEGRRETGQEAEDERAGDPPRACVAPLGLEFVEGRRRVPGDRGSVPDGFRPAPAQRPGPIAEQRAEGAFFGRGQRGFARGDLPVELPEQELARLRIAQARQHVTDGLVRERLGQGRHGNRAARVLRLPRAAGRLGHLCGCRHRGELQNGKKQYGRAGRCGRTDDHFPTTAVSSGKTRRTLARGVLNTVTKFMIPHRQVLELIDPVYPG